MILSDGTRTVKLNSVQFVQKAAHNLESLLGLCQKRHILLFTKTSCVVKKNNTVVGVNKHTGGIYALELQID